LKYNKAGQPDTRLVKPGKFTPFIPDEDGCADVLKWASPGEHKLERLPNGKYRHIASYTLDELIYLGWDGAMYVSTRGKHNVLGQYVPFINGYDSDFEDDYEPINVRAGKLARTIGRPFDEKGRHMIFRNMDGTVKRVQLY
jgi:hypothetical protein